MQQYRTKKQGKLPKARYTIDCSVAEDHMPLYLLDQFQHSMTKIFIKH